MQKLRSFLIALALALSLVGSARAATPNILLISVDTLRVDRMSGYGYVRNTSPNIDRLLAEGTRFAQARTVAPLTGPAMTSVFTSLDPHEHGATRNGLRMRTRLPSLTGILARRGYVTAAFVGNWTLKNSISGLGEHFGTYEDVLEHKRWFGLARREATAVDLSRRALEWLSEHIDGDDGKRPFLLWVHFIEPHAPYRLRREFLDQIGVKKAATFFSAGRRYDSEIAAVDHAIGEFLSDVRELVPAENLLTAFVADHGESLSEHGYWGHGRHVYDVSLRVPVGVSWPEHLEAGKVEESPALITDLAPTVLGLVGLPVPSHFRGHDWSPVMLRGAAPPVDRITYYQAHRAAVQPKENLEELRLRGLLEVSRIVDGRKEIYRVPNHKHRLFDLAEDPGEKDNLAAVPGASSDDLRRWLKVVQEGLARADELPPPSLTEEDIDALRALGYVD